jgi:hypothetical protein
MRYGVDTENHASISHRGIPDSASTASADATPSRRMVLGETQIKALEWQTSGESITEAAQLAGVARQKADSRTVAARGR